MCYIGEASLYHSLLTYLFLDPFPDDAGHLVSVELDYRVCDLYLSEGGEATL